MYYIYILECKDGTFYTGWTTNVEKRFEKHSAGKGAKYTRARLPLMLKYVEEFSTKKEALQREYYIKKLSREAKINLIYKTTCAGK